MPDYPESLFNEAPPREVPPGDDCDWVDDDLMDRVDEIMQAEDKLERAGFVRTDKPYGSGGDVVPAGRGVLTETGHDGRPTVYSLAALAQHFPELAAEAHLLADRWRER